MVVVIRRVSRSSCGLARCLHNSSGISRSVSHFWNSHDRRFKMRFRTWCKLVHDASYASLGCYSRLGMCGSTCRASWLQRVAGGRTLIFSCPTHSVYTTNYLSCVAFDGKKPSQVVPQLHQAKPCCFWLGVD